MGVLFGLIFYTPVSNDSWHILIVFYMGSIVKDFLFRKGYEFCYYSAYGGGISFLSSLPTGLVGASTEVSSSVFCLFHSTLVFKGVFFWCSSSEWA